MSFFDVINNHFVCTLIGVIAGSALGFLCGLWQHSLQNKRNYKYHQLDRLYGPVYALIQEYELHRKVVDDIIKNLWKGKCEDFTIGHCDCFDDYEVMAEGSANDAFKCSRKIFKLLTSNIMYARIADIPLIQIFNRKYCEHIAIFGSGESPPIFSNYLESTKMPIDFIETIKDGYDELILKLK